MFSKYSLGLIVLGSLLLMLNRLMSEYSEPLALIGFLLLFASGGRCFHCCVEKRAGAIESLVTIGVLRHPFCHHMGRTLRDFAPADVAEKYLMKKARGTD